MREVHLGANLTVERIMLHIGDAADNLSPYGLLAGKQDALANRVLSMPILPSHSRLISSTACPRPLSLSLVNPRERSGMRMVSKQPGVTTRYLPFGSCEYPSGAVPQWRSLGRSRDPSAAELVAATEVTPGSSVRRADSCVKKASRRCRSAYLHPINGTSKARAVRHRSPD
jgi:hypothetical protein